MNDFIYPQARVEGSAQPASLSFWEMILYDTDRIVKPIKIAAVASRR
jgi:hypothetical protein